MTIGQIPVDFESIRKGKGDRTSTDTLMQTDFNCEWINKTKKRKKKNNATPSPQPWHKRRKNKNVRAWNIFPADSCAKSSRHGKIEKRERGREKLQMTNHLNGRLLICKRVERVELGSWPSFESEPKNAVSISEYQVAVLNLIRPTKYLPPLLLLLLLLAFPTDKVWKRLEWSRWFLPTRTRSSDPASTLARSSSPFLAGYTNPNLIEPR